MMLFQYYILQLIYKGFEEGVFTYRYLFTNFEAANEYAKNVNNKTVIEYNIEKASFL